jgi:hypothetical protein
MIVQACLARVVCTTSSDCEGFAIWRLGIDSTLDGVIGAVHAPEDFTDLLARCERELDLEIYAPRTDQSRVQFLWVVGSHDQDPTLHGR